ncbi:MAG: DJ-1/PfpI family protein [Muribaculaceae bacterium]|nr:DJ-1/PfpI family protein [Muribaculaceae bacterium]
MERKSYLFLAEGFEEIEALTVVDILRRADMPVVTVSITDSYEVVGAHSIKVKADVLFKDADFAEVDWLILPGGMPGAVNLHNFEPLNELLKRQYLTGGKIAAICASPAVVLAPLGILDGKSATCYPGFEEMIHDAKVLDGPVVQDGSVITANGPAAAMRFALALVAINRGDDYAYELAGGLLLTPQSHQSFF